MKLELARLIVAQVCLHACVASMTGAGAAVLLPVFPVLSLAALLTGGATGAAMIPLQRHVGSGQWRLGAQAGLHVSHRNGLNGTVAVELVKTLDGLPGILRAVDISEELKVFG